MLRTYVCILFCHRWVVVHGMAGFGKTVLAAEAVRDTALCFEVFPGKYFWHVIYHSTAVIIMSAFVS